MSSRPLHWKESLPGTTTGLPEKPYTKNEFKIDQRPKCKSKTIKLSEENMGINLYDLNLEKNLEMTPKG